MNKNENQIVITIKDNANGIKEEIIHKIFEQHFTTKEKKGNGIGLFMSKQIIDEHMKGSLSVQNVPYEYNGKKYSSAQFTITLPL